MSEKNGKMEFCCVCVNTIVAAFCCVAGDTVALKSIRFDCRLRASTKSNDERVIRRKNGTNFIKEFNHVLAFHNPHLHLALFLIILVICSMEYFLLVLLLVPLLHVAFSVFN